MGWGEVRRSRAVVLAAAIVATSCSDNPGAPTPCGGWPEITLLSISPPSGTAVPRGRPVAIDATFHYSSCREGRVFTLIQDENERAVNALPEADGSVPNTHLPPGTGTERLRATVVVPGGPTRLSVHALFQYIGVRSGSTQVFTVIYPVVD
jgi:hypothetical protein